MPPEDTEQAIDPANKGSEAPNNRDLVAWQTIDAALATVRAQLAEDGRKILQRYGARPSN